MKNFSEWKTEMEQVVKDVDEKTKDWSNEDWEKDWKKRERDTMMEYFEDLSTGNTDHIPTVVSTEMYLRKGSREERNHRVSI